MDCLEQLVSKNSGTLRRTIVDVYDLGTIALYTPPPMKFEFQPMNTSSHIGGYQSNLRDFGIGSREDPYNFKISQPEPILMPKQDYNIPAIKDTTRYAKNCEDYGFGTIQNINVDFEKRETLKIYTDLNRNKISVGYQPFHTPNKNKNFLDLDKGY